MIERTVKTLTLKPLVISPQFLPSPALLSFIFSFFTYIFGFAYSLPWRCVGQIRISGTCSKLVTSELGSFAEGRIKASQKE